MITLTRHIVRREKVVLPYHVGNSSRKRRRIASTYRYALIEIATGRIVTTRARWLDAMFAGQRIERPELYDSPMDSSLTETIDTMSMDELARFRDMIVSQLSDTNADASV